MRAGRGAMVVGVAVVLVIACGVRSEAGQKAGAARLAVPSSAALAGANRSISEVYGVDLVDPSAKARLRLALRMLGDAARTNDDPAGNHLP